MKSIPSPRLAACAGSLLILSAAAPSQAAMLDQWGAFTQTLAYQCASSPCDNVDFFSELIGPADYQPQGNFADSSLINGTYGSAEGHANLSALPGLNIPNLRARAHGNSDHVTLGIARGVEAYTYTGASSTNIDLIITLTGNVTNPLDSSLSRILADVYVMDADAAEASVAPSGNILLENSLPTALQSSIGLDENAFGIVVGTIPLALDPGDSFYLLANLIAQAGDTGDADALSTLTLQFSDDSHLVASSAIPVPASVWLFASGLLGLVAVARRVQA